MDFMGWTAGIDERPAPNEYTSSNTPKDFPSPLRDEVMDASTQEADHRDLESTQMDVDGSSSDIDSGSEIDLDELEQMFNQACDYARESEWEDAEELHSKVLDGRRRILGEDNVHTLNSMCHLARVYRRLSELQDAETLWLQVLPACRRMLSGAQLETIRNIVLFADTLFINWMLEEAETLELEALSVCKRVLGDEHTETLVVMENLAIIYHKQGRIEEAAPLHRDVISMRKRILGAGHIDTINSMRILANACCKHDRLEEAEELYLQLRDSGFARDPRVDGSIMPKLARIYAEQEEEGTWDQVHLRIISIRKLRLGDEHVDTLRSIHELAEGYILEAEDNSDPGDYYETAMRLHRQVLVIRKRVLGDEHVDTLDSMCHLANSCYQCGKLDQAKQLYLQAIAIQNRTVSDSRIQTIDGVPICKRVLGDAHATTLEHMHQLVRVFIGRQRLEEAEQLLSQVVPMRVHALGEEHYDTFQSARDLELSALVTTAMKDVDV
ncbi:hypothetical protein FRC07_010349, partial [Ceratobasidium sp. 392]